MTYSSKSDIDAKKMLEKLNLKEDIDLYLFYNGHYFQNSISYSFFDGFQFFFALNAC